MQSSQSHRNGRAPRRNVRGESGEKRPRRPSSTRVESDNQENQAHQLGGPKRASASLGASRKPQTRHCLGEDTLPSRLVFSKPYKLSITSRRNGESLKRCPAA